MITEPAYLCLHVPEFAVQAMLRLRPELRGRPVVVMEGVAPLERVCSLNTEARQAGIQRNMTRAELDSFEQPHVLRRSAEEETSARAALMEVAGAFTPRLEDHTAGPHGTAGACVVVMDVRGTERLFGPVAQVARRLRKALRNLGIVAQVTASANLLTSIVAARYEQQRGRPVWILEHAKEAEALANLPIAVLKPTEAQAETFAAWGLRTVGELAALDEVDLVVRLGQEGAALWRLARGQAEHHMVPVEPGLVLEEVIEFEAPVEGLESLMFVLGPMLDQLIARVGNRAMELASVRVEMNLERNSAMDGPDRDAEIAPKYVRLIKPALPVADRRLLLKLLQLDFEAHPPGAEITRLRVTAEAGSRSRVQAGLFSPQMPEPGRLEVTLARLTALLGEGRVGRVRLLDSLKPESFAMEKFMVPQAREGHSKGSTVSQKKEETQKKLSELKRQSLQPKPRPEPAPESSTETGRVRLFPSLQTSATEFDIAGKDPLADRASFAVAMRRMRPAIPLSVRWQGDVMIGFYMQKVFYDVREKFGPWRRSGAWWTGEVWSREEWDVMVEAGGGLRLLCVLTHDLLRDRWYLEGMYD